MPWLYNRYVVLGIYVLGMTLIPYNDALLKIVSSEIPVFEFLVVRGAFMLFGVLLIPATYIALRQLGTAGFIQVFLRGSLLVITLVLLFVSISMVPLASAYAVFFTAPMMISILAVPILGERLTWVRIAALSLGMIGMVLNAQPWNDSFSPWLFVALAAAIVYATFQLVTRAMPQNVKVGAAMAGQQVAYIFWGCLISWLIWQFGWQNDSVDGLDFLTRDWVMPTLEHWGIFVLCSFITLVWGYAATFAYRMAEASFVAPIEYISLPVAAFWGYFLLDQTQNALQLFGLAVIVTGGVLMALDRPAAPTDTPASQNTA